MTTSIYFTESKDFKLIREKILKQENNYLVYVYADTSNIKIPKDLIRELPVYGNNLIWINTAEFDSSQLVNHVILTIGQYLTVEDSLEFFIASKTSKYDKALKLLESEDIKAELITPKEDIPEKKKKTGKRGRPKGSKNVKTKSALTVIAAPTTGKKKTRKKRVEKIISVEDINAKLKQFHSKDGDVELMQKKLFALGKVKRPKFDIKLSEMIQSELAIGASEADSLIKKMKKTGMMDNTGKGGRLMYKD